MKIAVCFFSATGRTEAMAHAITEGILEQVPGCAVQCLSINEITKEHPEHIAFVNEADGVLFGTPDYYAGECWQIKRWLDTCLCKLAGKLGGVFATANVPVGGPGLAIEHILTHLLVLGMMVYSGGTANGQPFIHLGPVCYRDHEEEGASLMRVFGRRFAAQTASITA